MFPFQHDSKYVHVYQQAYYTHTHTHTHQGHMLVQLITIQNAHAVTHQHSHCQWDELGWYCAVNEFEVVQQTAILLTAVHCEYKRALALISGQIVHIYALVARGNLRERECAVKNTESTLAGLLLHILIVSVSYFCAKP